MYSNGNSFNGDSTFGGDSGSSIAAGRRVPPWKFDVGAPAMWGDRGGM